MSGNTKKEKELVVLNMVEKKMLEAPPSSRGRLINYDNAGERYKLDKVYLRITVRQEKYFFYWRKSEKEGFEFLFELPRYVNPNYIGLASFHGFTKEEGIPLKADTIPAYIDYIRFSPL